MTSKHDFSNFPDSWKLAELVGRKLEMAPIRMLQQLTDKTKKQQQQQRVFYEAVDTHGRRRLINSDRIYCLCK